MWMIYPKGFPFSVASGTDKQFRPDQPSLFLTDSLRTELVGHSQRPTYRNICFVRIPSVGGTELSAPKKDENSLGARCAESKSIDSRHLFLAVLE